MSKHMAGPWGTWGDAVIRRRGVKGPTAAGAMRATRDISNSGYCHWDEVLTECQKVAAIALGESQEQASANARLIAAAPDLMEALQELDMRLRACHSITTAREAYDSFYQELVRGAIAKATGEQQ